MKCRKRRMTLGVKKKVHARHSPHNEAVNVVIPIHVAKLEVSGDAKKIRSMRK